MAITDAITKMVGDKRRWRAYRARAHQLPSPYREAIAGYERYLLHLGPADGENAATMFEDLVDLFEQGAASSTPISELVGHDPVEFAETFLQNYVGGGWVGRERARLASTVADAISSQSSGEAPSDGAS